MQDHTFSRIYGSPESNSFGTKILVIKWAALVGGLFHFKPSVRCRYWQFASFRCAAKLVAYWSNSGVRRETGKE